MMRACLLTLIVMATLVAVPAADDAPQVPGIEDLLKLRTVGGVQISPDGKWVAYGVTETDFKQDAFVTQLWLAAAAGGAPVQLTRGDKSAGSPQWSPDGRWLAFTSARVGDKNQIFAIRPDGGEAVQLTKCETAVNGFAWSPDGDAHRVHRRRCRVQGARRTARSTSATSRSSAASTTTPPLDARRGRGAQGAGRRARSAPRATTFSVGGSPGRPTATRLAFSATINPDLVQGAHRRRLRPRPGGPTR